MPAAALPIAQGFLGWDATEWYAFGTNLLAAAAVVGGFWALYSYRKTQRADAAQWVQGLFKDFYTDHEVIEGRELLEYDFEDRLGPLLLLRVTDRYVRLNERQREDLRRTDLVLNYFEQLLYLESEGHILKRDTEVFFDYWFRLMASEERAGLRRYLARCGYERCTEELGLQYDNPELVALYGSLMREFSAQDELDVRDKLEYIGPCTIKGKLFSLGDWPGMVEGADNVVGELFRVRNNEVFRKLDVFEHFNPAEPDGCKYVRRAVRLVDPDVDAWTYFYRWALDGAPYIDHGSWSRYVSERT